MIGSEDERVNQDVGTPREGPDPEEMARPRYRQTMILDPDGPYVLAHMTPTVRQLDRLIRIEVAARALVEARFNGNTVPEWKALRIALGDTR